MIASIREYQVIPPNRKPLYTKKITSVTKEDNNTKKQIREGKIIKSPWMNTYDFNSMFEDIVSEKWKIFYNT